MSGNESKDDSWLLAQYRERVEVLEARCEELRRADEYNRKAISQLLKTLEEKRELQRSRKVEAEREECALTLVALAKETQDQMLKQAFVAGAIAIRDRRKP